MVEQKNKQERINAVLSKAEQRDLRILAELNAQRRHLEDKLDSITRDYTATIDVINKKYKTLLEKTNLKSLVLGEDEIKLLRIIQNELDTGIDMVPEDVIINLAKNKGFMKIQTKVLLDSLEMHGEIYKPRHRFYKTPSNKLEVN
ncbi:MAG: hypothetical protein WC746_03725 [archaeon]